MNFKPVLELLISSDLFKLYNANFRRYCLLAFRFGSIPRYSDFIVNLDGLRLVIPDSASFLSSYKEIFVNDIYSFRKQDRIPRILDLGANIGISVVYFKRLFPESKIVAVEADPKIFSYLLQNVHGNGFTDVQLLNRAVWDRKCVLAFSGDGADGGRIAMKGDPNLIEVETTDIRELLSQETFDFVKMDIEGAEEVVLPACKDYLKNVKHMFVEYHSKAGHRQGLHLIINAMAEAGFRIHIHNVACSPRPFAEVKSNSGYDLQLNIFGWKEVC